MEGEIALIRKGILFCRQQLAHGIECFGSVSSSEDDEPIVEENVSIQEDTITQEVESITTISNEFDLDLILSTGEQILKEEVGGYDVVDIDIDSIKIDFHHRLSQSTIGNRNGSNACVVISLIGGYVFSKMLCFEVDDLVNAVVGCMEVGNLICEENESFSNLTIDEAMAMLPSVDMVQLKEERNVIVSRDDILQLEISLSSDSTIDFFVVIANEKALPVIKCRQHVIVFDSHADPPRGACIAKAPIENLSTTLQDFFDLSSEQLFYIALLSIER